MLKVTRVDTSLLPDLNWIPMAALLVDRERRFLLGNRQMARIFRLPAPGADMSLVIRSPELLEAFDSASASDKRTEFRLTRSGHVDRYFTGWIEPLASESEVHDGLFLVTVFETTKTVEAERMRSTFVADVSHELRSPLTTMIATLETLQGRAGDEPELRKKFVDMIAGEANRMHGIVNDLLALSATEARKHIAPSGDVELAPLLEQLVETFAQKLDNKGMTVSLEIQEGLPSIRGESDELRKVFQNLVDNAVKYGVEGTGVRVGLYADTDGVSQTVYVNNMGNTIPARHIPRLTERFYRVDNSRSRSMGGTGLGLAIVKHILGRHEGRIHIESSEEEGTTFLVTLPTGRP